MSLEAQQRSIAATSAAREMLARLANVETVYGEDQERRALATTEPWVAPTHTNLPAQLAKLEQALRNSASIDRKMDEIITESIALVDAREDQMIVRQSEAVAALRVEMMTMIGELRDTIAALQDEVATLADNAADEERGGNVHMLTRKATHDAA